MGEWHTMDTAPKDGSRILAYGAIGFETELGIGTVKWDDFRKRWIADPCEASEYDPEDCTVIYWMPLPQPPTK